MGMNALRGRLSWSSSNYASTPSEYLVTANYTEESASSSDSSPHLSALPASPTPQEGKKVKRKTVSTKSLLPHTVQGAQHSKWSTPSREHDHATMEAKSRREGSLSPADGNGDTTGWSGQLFETTGTTEELQEVGGVASAGYHGRGT